MLLLSLLIGALYQLFKLFKSYKLLLYVSALAKLDVIAFIDKNGSSIPPKASLSLAYVKTNLSLLSPNI
uniref:Uncharacterized protein n=1 Tax=viral metagenome TaxID=1070528 RepID=A0A6C0HL32_9ZZZZ